MAPVVCTPDIPVPRTDAACPCAGRRRRIRANGIDGKHRTAEMRRMSIARVRPESSYDTPPASPVSASDSPIDLRFPNSPESSLCARIPIDRDDRWIIVKRRQGLLNIVARTIALVRRNHILEKKVEALRLETRSFVSSVLNNPENKGKETRREPTICRVDSKVDDVVASTTDETSVRAFATSGLGSRVDESRRRVLEQAAATSTRNSTSTEYEPRSPEMLDR